LRAAGAPTIEVEISNACAYPQETWHVMGTAGGLRGSHERLEWKWLDVASLPDRPVDRATAAADRRFNREELSWHEETWTKEPEESPDYAAFHEDVYATVRQGASLKITPHSVRRVLSVQRCRAAAE